MWTTSRAPKRCGFGCRIQPGDPYELVGNGLLIRCPDHAHSPIDEAAVASARRLNAGYDTAKAEQPNLLGDARGRRPDPDFTLEDETKVGDASISKRIGRVY